jgi:hypothetical protein
LEAVLNAAMMSILEKSGRHMGFAGDQLSAWMGYTQTSRYLDKVRADPAPTASEAGKIIAEILTEEVSALNTIFQGSPYLSGLVRGSRETLKPLYKVLHFEKFLVSAKPVAVLVLENLNAIT